jgi:hypothetical protein
MCVGEKFGVVAILRTLLCQNKGTSKPQRGSEAQDSLSCFLYMHIYSAVKSNKLFARAVPHPFVCDDKLEDICFLLLPAQQRSLFISPFCFLSAARHLICLRAERARSTQRAKQLLLLSFCVLSLLLCASWL